MLAQRPGRSDREPGGCSSTLHTHPDRHLLGGVPARPSRGTQAAGTLLALAPFWRQVTDPRAPRAALVGFDEGWWLASSPPWARGVSGPAGQVGPKHCAPSPWSPRTPATCCAASSARHWWPMRHTHVLLGQRPRRSTAPKRLRAAEGERQLLLARPVGGGVLGRIGWQRAAFCARPHPPSMELVTSDRRSWPPPSSARSRACVTAADGPPADAARWSVLEDPWGKPRRPRGWLVWGGGRLGCGWVRGPPGRGCRRWRRRGGWRRGASSGWPAGARLVGSWRAAAGVEPAPPTAVEQSGPAAAPASPVGSAPQCQLRASSGPSQGLTVGLWVRARSPPTWWNAPSRRLAAAPGPALLPPPRPSPDDADTRVAGWDVAAGRRRWQPLRTDALGRPAPGPTGAAGELAG